MKLLKYNYFLEKNLTLADLSKPVKTGGMRGDILIDKIEKGEPIKVKRDAQDEQDIVLRTDVDQLKQGGKFSPEKAKEFLKDTTKTPSKNYAPAFKGPKDKTYKYKLNDIVKVEDFGSSGGSSLGFSETRVVESIQTLLFAWKQNNSQNQWIVPSQFTKQEFLKSVCETRNAFIPNTITPKIIEDHSGYLKTFIKTANAFIHNKDNFEANKAILKHGRIYNFYQIGYESGFILKIYETYKRCCKRTTAHIDSLRTGKNAPGFVINIAKWTPSDVWAISKEHEVVVKKALDKCSNMEELNKLIDILFDDRVLIGISLKKIDPEKKHFPIVVNKETPDPQYEIQYAILSPDPYTKGSTLAVKWRSEQYEGENKIAIRSNSSAISNINLEIEGASSRHGKCSLSVVNDLLEDQNLPKVPLTEELRGKTEDDLKEMVYDLDESLKGVDVGGEQALSLTDPDVSPTTRGRTKEASISVPALISKYQSLYLLKILLENKVDGEEEADSVVNSIMHYALAIKNRYFVCPKYARVVEYLKK